MLEWKNAASLQCLNLFQVVVINGGLYVVAMYCAYMVASKVGIINFPITPFTGWPCTSPTEPTLSPPRQGLSISPFLSVRRGHVILLHGRLQGKDYQFPYYSLKGGWSCTSPTVPTLSPPPRQGLSISPFLSVRRCHVLRLHGRFQGSQCFGSVSF